MPGNPYDGHTLATVIPDMEALVGNTITRILADKGYRGHHAPPDYKFRVFISGQKRGVTSAIKRQSRRRSAVEPVISHLKAEHRMGRNYLRHRRGDAARRRWLQLPPPDPLAQHLVASIPQRSPGGASTRPGLSATFSTDDEILTGFGARPVPLQLGHGP
jgi:hypothetical protein